MVSAQQTNLLHVMVEYFLNDDVFHSEVHIIYMGPPRNASLPIGAQSPDYIFAYYTYCTHVHTAVIF